MEREERREEREESLLLSGPKIASIVLKVDETKILVAEGVKWF